MYYRGTMTSLMFCFIALLTVVSDCYFLSIKLPQQKSFIYIGSYDPLGHILKDSLTNILMQYDIEIIISRSKQIAFSKKIIDSHYDDYPYWKLIDIIHKNDYEGIHLSIKDNLLVIHALLFEIDNPIPFSISTKWSVQVGPCEIFKHSFIFSASSLRSIAFLTGILFRSNLTLQIFKKFSIITKKGGYILTPSKSDPPRAPSAYKPYYRILKEEIVKLYFSKKVKNAIYHEFPNGICNVNSITMNSFDDAIKALEIALETSQNIISINNLSNQIFNIEFENHNSIIIASIFPNLFIEAFKNVFGKLFFNLSSKDALIYIDYNPIKKELKMKCNSGDLSLLARKYFTFSLEKYGIECREIRENLSFIPNFIKIEDQNDNQTFGHHVNGLKNFNFNLFLSNPSIRRIILFNEYISYFTKVKRIGMDSSKDILILPESELIPKITKWIDNGDRNMGMEIIFNHQNHQILISFLKLETKILHIPTFSSGYLWDYMLFKIGIEKSIIYSSIKFHYQIPLNLWKFLERDSFIIILKKGIPIDSIVSSKKTIIEINDLNENSRIILLDLVLSRRLPCNINQVRLNYRFNIEMSIENSMDLGKCMNFISEKLGIILSIKNIKRSRIIFNRQKKSILENEMTGFIVESFQNGRIFDLCKSLSWKEAMKKLIGPPPTLPSLSLSTSSSSSSTSSIVQIVERARGYPFYGNLKVFYCKNEIDLHEYIEMQNDKKDDIVRMGKGIQYAGSNYSFFFAQSMINEREGFCNWMKESGKNCSSMSLNLTNEMNGFDRIIEFITRIFPQIFINEDQWIQD